MTVSICRAIAILLLVCFASQAQAVVKLNDGFNAFAGFGTNFSPGTFRLGYNAWEGGMISSGFVGAIKSFNWGQSTYSSFGLGFNADGFSSNLGFQAAVGFDYDMIWELGLRGELMGRTNFNGNSVGLAHLT